MEIASVQIAFQGGGAKFIEMLPVADAFLTAQHEGIVNISGVSGTSAGSICAALVAKNADMEKVRKFLKNNAAEIYENMISKEVKEINEELHTHEIGKIRTYWTAFKHRKVLNHIIVKGKPIFEHGELYSFIKIMMKEAGKQLKFQDLNVPLFVMASNVASSKAEVIKSGPIIDAVVTSCSLPIIFRSFHHLTADHHVDGGLCENLPIEPLLENSSDPIFAVFPVDAKATEPIDNLISYIVALFSVSVEHNIHRAKELVSPAFHMPIDTELSTLDFENALSLISNDDWYENRKRSIYQQIENFSVSYGSIHSKNQYRTIDLSNKDEYVDTLRRMTEDFEEFYEYEKASYHITLNSSEKLTEDRIEARRADTVQRTAQIKVKGSNFKYYRSTLQLDPFLKRIVPTVWSARKIKNDKSTELDIQVLSLSSQTSASQSSRECLIEFKQSDDTQKLKDGDIIEIEDISYSRMGLSDLHIGRSDYAGFSNTHVKVIKNAEVSLSYPKRLGKLIAIVHPNKTTACSSSQTTTYAQDSIQEGKDFEKIGASAKKLEHGGSLYIQINHQTG